MTCVHHVLLRFAPSHSCSRPWATRSLGRCHSHNVSPHYIASRNSEMAVPSVSSMSLRRDLVVLSQDVSELFHSIPPKGASMSVSTYGGHPHTC